MNTVVSITETALPVLLALALGMLCRKIGFLTRDGVDTLKKVVMNLTLPAVLVNAFATAEYSTASLVIPVIVYFLCCVALGLGYLIIRLSGMKSRLAPFLATGFEAGMLGYALFSLLFPDRSISSLAILDIGHTLFVFTLYKTLITGKRDLKAIGRDMITTPILWAVCIGLLLGATGLYNAMKASGTSGILDCVTSFLSAPTAMIILLTIGYDLVPGDIPWKKTAGLVAMRAVTMGVFYGLIVLLNRTILNGVLFEGAALLLAILPPPYVIPVLSDEPGERVQISSALSAMTLLTIIAFAVYSVVLRV